MENCLKEESAKFMFSKRVRLERNWVRVRFKLIMERRFWNGSTRQEDKRRPRTKVGDVCSM